MHDSARAGAGSPGRAPFPRHRRRARPGTWIGVALVGGFLVAGIGEPLINAALGHRCTDMPKPETPPPGPPGAGHPLGTDEQGRDLLARLLCGSRTSMLVGITAEVIALGLGVLLGAWAGFAGGRTDSLLMRFTDIVLAFPFPLVAIAVIALLGSGGTGTILLLLGLFGWPAIARLVRSRLLVIRESEFVTAARALGARDLRVLLRHALPAALAPAWAAASVGVAGNILAEAWLSFIGLGDQSRTSWGTILQEARTYVSTAWWYALYPGLAITLTILGFMLLGDALRRALDPHAAPEIP